MMRCWKLSNGRCEVRPRGRYRPSFPSRDSNGAVSCIFHQPVGLECEFKGRACAPADARGWPAFANHDRKGVDILSIARQIAKLEQCAFCMTHHTTHGSPHNSFPEWSATRKVTPK